MAIGTGRDYVQSRKQKLDTKISTDADLFGVDNILTKGICNWYLLKY